MQDEIAVLSGEHTITVFFDLTKFFDSVNLSKLIEFAIQADFPLGVLAYDLQFHLAPRFVKWNQWLADCIMPDIGVVAGLKFSSTLSRLILYPVISAMHYQVPKSLKHAVEIFIDDVAQTMYSDMPGTSSSMPEVLCASCTPSSKTWI